MAKMRELPVNDFYVKNGHVREDGRLVHDMLFAQVKTPAESTRPWDYYKILGTIPGDQAFRPLAEGRLSAGRALTRSYQLSVTVRLRLRASARRNIRAIARFLELGDHTGQGQHMNASHGRTGFAGDRGPTASIPSEPDP